ncbi:uncharacterized protein [Nicotiana sylvestris]|uniref:uncharacterized protein n=1 Tax=Nicotiana sylvestris TaxID=4096 RepID=UPI00388CCDEF
MIKKGCIYHLVLVTDTNVEALSLESVPVVNEFSGVFPDELPGIPPDREIDFGIDVIPGTQPISIPPYRMAPTELKKLNEQLKDLLEKGFIQPSVSPWGAPVLEGIMVDPQKIAAVKNWPRPTTPTEIRRLGWVLQEKAVKFQWSNACEKSFQELKSALTTTPVLAMLEDTLSRKSMGSLAHLEVHQRPLAREVHQLASLGVRLVNSNEGGVIVQNRVELSLVAEVKKKQFVDLLLAQLKEGILKHKTTAFSFCMNDSTQRYQDRLCVPDIDGLRERIMEETHTSRPRGSVHSQLLKKFQQGLGTQVNLSTTFHPQIDVQAERTIQMLEDMLRACTLDFKGSWDDYLPLIEFAYNNSFHASIQMAPFEALHGRRCRSPIGWFEVGETELIGLDLVHQDMEKVKIIKERLKTAQSRQKSYSDVRRRDLEFKEDDWVFLKVSPMKNIMRFGKKGKLSPRKVVGDPSTIVPVETMEVNEELSYEEVPVAILDRQVRKLRNKEIASVKVLWRNQQVEEATWEAEDEMKRKHPHFF